MEFTEGSVASGSEFCDRMKRGEKGEMSMRTVFELLQIARESPTVKLALREDGYKSPRYWHRLNSELSRIRRLEFHPSRDRGEVDRISVSK